MNQKQEGGLTTIGDRMNRFAGDRRGAAAIEYALIAALIAVAILASITLLGASVGDRFTLIGGEVASAR